MRPIHRLSQILGALGIIGIFEILAFAAWGAFRILTYEQTDDLEHLESKRACLSEIARQTSIAKISDRSRRPNLLVILFDDLGHGDLGAFGSSSIATPNIDRLAEEGLFLENYHAPSPVCTSSRAALLAGRYAPRAGLDIVAFPDGHPISQVRKAAGYRTGMVGKWHLGDRAPSLPTRFGFDSYFGALYSNDIKPFALYRGEEIAYPAPFDQTRLSEVYTEAALDFLQANDEAPFFLYYAHNFPHVPLFNPDQDTGRSRAGLYGDVVEGLDDSVGTILELLEERGELDDTLILLTSDNGPWFEGDPGRGRVRKTQTGRAKCACHSSPLGRTGSMLDAAVRSLS